MSAFPQAAAYRPDPAIGEIADFIADPVEAADFPETRLRFRNDRWAERVGLGVLSDDAWLAHFGRFSPLPDNLEHPLALRYHGHQFRVYNPEIGDGRGFLFAQLRDDAGRLLDLGTKGSGQTPWSRFGDGRLTLKGAVREILATEMLEALGVDTSKTFSVIETGEALHRGDEPSPPPSAVLVRLNHGHIRIGSFQRLATLGDDDNLKRLARYALRHYHGEDAGDDAPVRLLHHVVRKTATLAAQFMAAGFVHGVLNSDNINISGESFDYGPWRFAPSYDPGFTAAYFDQGGLYAFGRQPEAIHWDVVQLAVALARIAPQDPLVEAINGFEAIYRAAFARHMLWRLGVTPLDDTRDAALARAVEAALQASQAGIDRFFHDWQGGSLRNPAATDYAHPAFQALADAAAGYRPSRNLGNPYWQSPESCSMLIEEVEAIWAPIADADDWSAFDRKIASIRRFGMAMSSLG
jgi:uncharacterized protein YdiU (UPF0061 family)